VSAKADTYYIIQNLYEKKRISNNIIPVALAVAVAATRRGNIFERKKK